MRRSVGSDHFGAGAHKQIHSSGDPEHHMRAAANPVLGFWAFPAHRASWRSTSHRGVQLATLGPGSTVVFGGFAHRQPLPTFSSQRKFGRNLSYLPVCPTTFQHCRTLSAVSKSLGTRGELSRQLLEAHRTLPAPLDNFPGVVSEHPCQKQFPNIRTNLCRIS